MPGHHERCIVKIGILSDIHVDLEHDDPRRVLDPLADEILRRQVDLMIIAGDVANDYRLTLESLARIEHRSGVRCLFVPGNHDIWNEKHPDQDAWRIYEALKAFPGNLANGAVTLDNDWVVIGDLGWYDYSFGSRRYSEEEFDRMQIGSRLWQDKIKAIWQAPTLEMHRYFRAKLQKQLEAHRGRDIILVTHVLPVRDFAVFDLGPMWEYLNAFLGSRQYGELALEFGVAYSISGHVHYRREVRHEGTTFICNCLNYLSQWQGNRDPAVEIARAFKAIEID